MIAIPNMDKPKSCTECPFEVIDISGYPRCVIVQEMVVDGNLFNRCPLIDIAWCWECIHKDDICHYCHEHERNIKDSDFCSYGIGRE